MANLTSSLTLSLKDLLSKPAVDAAAALKKFGLSAQDLQKSVKLDAFRQLQQSFAQARTTFRDAQQSVQALAKQLAATDNPTKQMQRSFAQAKREVTSASAAFQQQSAALIAAKASLQSIGVPLNQIATEETRLKGAAQAATTAMEQQAVRAQSIGARIRRGMGTAFGNFAPFLGPPILGATYKSLKAGAAIDSAETGLRAAGISASEIESVSKIVMAQQARFPQLPINEILDRYKEERSITSSPAEAQRLLPVIAQTMAVLKTMGDGTTTGMGFALKAAQVLGAAQNPERLTSFMEAFLKAKQVKGELITPEQMYSFFAGIKGSGAMLSDRFLHTTAMSLAAELKGGRAGSGIDAFVKATTAPMGETAKEFVELGLMSRSDFKPLPQRGGFGKSFGRSSNKLGEVKLGAHVVDWELAQTDPDKWVAEYLLPALRQKGITDMPAILAMVEKIFPGRSSDVVTKLITQAESYKKDAEKMREALGGAATDLYKGDAAFQLDVLRQAFSNFGGVLTGPLMEPAAYAMNYVARGVSGWAKSIAQWNKENPGWAKAIGGTAVATGLGAGGALTYGLLRGLMGGFGLKSSAVALDGSAAALTRAAIALGGSNIVGSGAGAAGAASKGIAGSVAKNLLMGAGIAGGLLAIDSAIYDNLPEETKKDLQRREDAMNAIRPAGGMSKAEILRRAANSDRQRQRISPIGDFTLDSSRGFRLDAGPARNGFAPISPPPIEGREPDAKAAGERFGSAFRRGVAEQVESAVADVRLAVDKMIALMTFGASPSITPSGGVATGAATAGAGAHGLFTDYGIRP